MHLEVHGVDLAARQRDAQHACGGSVELEAGVVGVVVWHVALRVAGSTFTPLVFPIPGIEAVDCTILIVE
jgi:hypothetical protein